MATMDFEHDSGVLLWSFSIISEISQFPINVIVKFIWVPVILMMIFEEK